MKTGQIFKVNLRDGTSTALRFQRPSQPGAGGKQNATFVDNLEVMKLDEPTGLAVDGKGRLIVADRGQNAVYLFDHDDGDATLIRSLPFSHGKLNSPVGIHYDAKSGQVYVASSKAKTVLTCQL